MVHMINVMHFLKHRTRITTELYTRINRRGESNRRKMTAQN